MHHVCGHDGYYYEEVAFDEGRYHLCIKIMGYLMAHVPKVLKRLGPEYHHAYDHKIERQEYVGGCYEPVAFQCSRKPECL